MSHEHCTNEELLAEVRRRCPTGALDSMAANLSRSTLLLLLGEYRRPAATKKEWVEATKECSANHSTAPPPSEKGDDWVAE